MDIVWLKWGIYQFSSVSLGKQLLSADYHTHHLWTLFQSEINYFITFLSICKKYKYFIIFFYIPHFFSSLWFVSNSKYILLSSLERKSPTLYFGSSSVRSVMLAGWHTTEVKVHNIFSKQLCSFGSNSKLFNATEKILLIYCDSWHSSNMLLVFNKWLSLPTRHVKFQGPAPIPRCTCQINVNMMKPNNDIVFHSFSGLGAAWLQWETSSQCLPHLTTVSSSTNIREQAKKRPRRGTAELSGRSLALLCLWRLCFLILFLLHLKFV